jgi:hypothetical protein
VCLVGEPLERSGAVPRSGDGFNPSHVWLQRLGWSGSDPFFCLVGGTKYGMDSSFNTVNGSHMSQSVEVSGSHMSCIFILLIPHWILSSRIRSPVPPAWAIPASWAWASAATDLGEPRGRPGSGRRGAHPAPPPWANPATGLGELCSVSIGEEGASSAPPAWASSTGASRHHELLPGTCVPPPWRKKEARERETAARRGRDGRGKRERI